MASEVNGVSSGGGAVGSKGSDAVVGGWRSPSAEANRPVQWVANCEGVISVVDALVVGLMCYQKRLGLAFRSLGRVERKLWRACLQVIT